MVLIAPSYISRRWRNCSGFLAQSMRTSCINAEQRKCCISGVHTTDRACAMTEETENADCQTKQRNCCRLVNRRDVHGDAALIETVIIGDIHQPLVGAEWRAHGVPSELVRAGVERRGNGRAGARSTAGGHV